MQGLEIVDLIFFCTRIHYKYFRYEYASMFLIFVRKYRKYTINRWRVLYAVCASRGDFTIKTLVVFARKLAWKHIEAFYSYVTL